jgi:riboflavin synthase
MFTGIVRERGRVASFEEGRLVVESGIHAGLGDSVAVDGVCLTVVSADASGVHADVSPETARVTTIGTLKRGSSVNLERPLRADGRFGGHFVQGHVDGTGTIEELREDGDSYWLTVKFPAALAPFIVRKGSIAVNGVSLTVAGLDDRHLDVQIIPHTWAQTTFHTLRAGDPVNLECDLLGKYVARAIEVSGATSKLRP